MRPQGSEADMNTGAQTAEENTANVSGEQGNPEEAAQNPRGRDNGSGAVGSNTHGSESNGMTDANQPPQLEEAATIDEKIEILRRYINQAMEALGQPGKFNDLLTFWSLRAQNAALVRLEIW